MKFQTILLLFSTAIFSASVTAIPIGTTGGSDTFVARTNLANSGEGTEETWICSVLGCDPNTIVTDKEDNGDGWSMVDGYENLYAHGGGTLIDYFMVKFGAGKGTGIDYANVLYKNDVASLDYLVLDLWDFVDEGSPLPKMTISHYRFTKVPEPGSLALLAIGLFGLRLSRKRQFNSK